jgi:hypothetical protein
MGELDFDLGRIENAVRRYDEDWSSRSVAPEGAGARARAPAWRALCCLGRLDDAERSIERARRLARLTDDRLEHAASYRTEGDIAWARGLIGEAQRAGPPPSAC